MEFLLSEFVKNDNTLLEFVETITRFVKVNILNARGIFNFFINKSRRIGLQKFNWDD